MGRRCRRDDGQAVPLTLALVGLAVVLMFALGSLAGDVVDAGRARTAADAAALAAVEGGRAAAARFAERHGGSLVVERERLDGDGDRPGRGRHRRGQRNGW